MIRRLEEAFVARATSAIWVLGDAVSRLGDDIVRPAGDHLCEAGHALSVRACERWERQDAEKGS